MGGRKTIFQAPRVFETCVTIEVLEREQVVYGNIGLTVDWIFDIERGLDRVNFEYHQLSRSRVVQGTLADQQAKLGERSRSSRR